MIYNQLEPQTRHKLQTRLRTVRTLAGVGRTTIPGLDMRTVKMMETQSIEAARLYQFDAFARACDMDLASLMTVLFEDTDEQYDEESTRLIGRVVSKMRTMPVHQQMKVLEIIKIIEED